MVSIAPQNWLRKSLRYFVSLGTRVSQELRSKASMRDETWTQEWQLSEGGVEGWGVVWRAGRWL